MKKIVALLSLSLVLVLAACNGTTAVTLSSVHGDLDTSVRWLTTLASDDSYIALTVTRLCPRTEDSILCDRSHALNDILDGLGFESNVIRRMGETRALDGRQTAENDNFRVSWTFHPDDGLQVLFENN